MSKRKDKFDYLRDLYYDPESGAAYARLNLLYDFVRKDNKYYFTKLEIKKWLDSQPTFSEHKPASKERPSGRIYTNGSLYQYDLDVAYMNDVKGVKTNKFLIAVDVFDRRIAAEALRSLKWDHMKVGLDKIFKKLGVPAKVRTDRGTEMTSKNFAEYMKKRNIDHFLASPPHKSALAERGIRSLKLLISRLVENRPQTSSWLSALPLAVTIYSNRKHSSINMTPIEASKPQNKSKVMQFLNHKALQRYGNPITKYEFNIGNLVRVLLAKGNLSKEHMKTFSEQIYTVKERKRRDNVNYYTLSDEGGNEIGGTFKAYELTSASELKPFIIKKVLPHQKTIGGVLHYLVEWVDHSERSFIPKDKIKDYSP